jgi:outer membrane protein assembly factor BamB
MGFHSKSRRSIDVRRFIPDYICAERGNILVYVLMVMVIFGLLGVAMVSIFSTSVSSSATRNDTRRAAYLSEAGIRYAISELRASDFAKTTIDNLNATTYKTSSTESFQPNIFSPWFEPEAEINISTDETNAEIVEIPEGKLPPGFNAIIPTEDPFLALVNYDYIDPTGGTSISSSARAFLTAVSDVPGNPKRLQLTIDGSTEGFVAGKNETLCLAVNPLGNQNVNLPGAFLLRPEAAKIFPAVGGAFEINGHGYYYEKAIDKGAHLELIGVHAVAGEKSPWKDVLNASLTDYVILSPRNRFIISEGKSGDVAFGNNMAYAVGVADTSIGGSQRRKPDIDFEEEDLETVLEQRESPGNTSLFTIDNDPGDKFISIGDGTGSSFGTIWFRDTRSVGGQREFCKQGKCKFGLGIRAFFTFTSTGNSGEGFIFALTNGQENSINSAGGDIQRSELLGYSGDSRTKVDPAPPPSADFLDGSGKGLKPPKIGFEFDTRVNYSSTFEQNQSYCSNGTLVENTRNDPLSSDKHAVQYVFWASDSISPPCRDTDGRATYDDNRHDAFNLKSSWTKNLSGNTNSDPLIRSSDGTIYIGSAANRLFALNPDGTENWPFSIPTGEVYSPVLAGGKIYVGSEDGKVYAIDPSNGDLIKEYNTGFPVRTKPVVDSDGFVYVTAGPSLFKIDFSASPPSAISFNPGVGNATSSPALSPDGNTVYAGFSDGKLQALKTFDLTRRWPTGSAPIGQVFGIPAVASDGYIYVSTSGTLGKINPASGNREFQSGSKPTSSPTLSKDGNTVYAGFIDGLDGRLYALDSTNLGVIRWLFPTSGSIGTSVATPAVDDSGNIYVGSNKNIVYALSPDGSLKWQFDTGGEIMAKPAIDQKGTVYVGSNSGGGQLWAISQFAEPRNYRQNLENPPNPELEKNLVAYAASNAENPYYTNISNPDKWFKDGPWGVRIEIERNPLTGERAEYILRAWVQQCLGSSCLETFLDDTRIKYNPITKPPNLVQSFELDGTLNPKFDTFLFGFTSAKKDNDDQVITIDNFQLSFIRPGDPEITTE